MEELVTLLKSISFGTVSGWVLVVAVILGYMKIRPALEKIKLERDVSLIAAQSNEIVRLNDRVAHLEDKLEECHRGCEEKCNKMQDIIHGMKMQRAQEQLTFIKMFPPHMMTPEMKSMVEQLEIIHLQSAPPASVDPVPE